MEKERDSFFVTVLSNASQEIYSNNTTTQFSNILAEPINLPPNQNWKVCLHSITITNASNMNPENLTRMREVRAKLDKYIGIVGYHDHAPRSVIKLCNSYYNTLRVDTSFTNHVLFVECDQISTEFENKGKTMRVLSTQMPSPDKPYTTFEPVFAEYFGLSSHYIPKISINIRNIEGHNLKTLTSQSTIVVLKFKKMSRDEMDYRVVLVENPDGSIASDFRVSLPDNLMKDGTQNPWEVALTKMTYMPEFEQFEDKLYRGAASYWFSNGFDMNEEIEKFVTKTDWADNSYGSHFQYSLPRAFINDDIFLQYLSSTFNKKYLIETNKWLVVKFEFTPSTKRVQVMTNYASILSVSNEVLYCLGFEIAGLTKCPRFPEQNSLLLLPEDNAVVQGVRSIDSNYMTPNNLLLYVDCVESSLIGNVYGQYLTNVSVPRKKDNVPIVTYEPKNLEYHRIITGDLSNVHFKFLKSDGKPPKFYNRENKHRILLSLLFRKKKNNL